MAGKNEKKLVLWFNKIGICGQAPSDFPDFAEKSLGIWAEDK